MVVQFVPVQDQLIGVILSDSGKSIEVLSGILGSGKTSILRHLNDSRAYGLRVQLEDFNPGHHGQQGDTGSVGAVQASFQQFEELLQTLISKVGTADDLEVMMPGLASGMVPKMEACLRAVRGGVPQAHVLDGRVTHAILREIFTDSGIGTMVTP